MSQSLFALNEAASPSIFNFGSHAVRIIVRDGDPWFVAGDVASALGYRDAANAARNLKDHQRGTHNLSTPSGVQRVTIITESGLYKLVLRSRKPEAEEFSDWVTGEVLPSIRKTGSYSKVTTEETIAPLNTQAMAAASKQANEYFDAARQGKYLQQPTAFPPEVLCGLLAQAMLQQRFMLSFDRCTGRMNIKPVPDDAYVLSWQQFARAVVTNDIDPSNTELAELASACNQRLSKRLAA